MSHYSLIVVGENIDEQLKRFSQTDESFYQFIPIDRDLEAEKFQNNKYLQYAWETLENYLASVYTFNPEKNEFCRYTNPDAKWDWYEIGGRWSKKVFKTSQDYVDVAIKKDIINLKTNQFITFSILKDNIWYQKGEMHFFGMVSNELSELEWQKQFNQVIDSIPENETLTLVDCHI